MKSVAIGLVMGASLVAASAQAETTHVTRTRMTPHGQVMIDRTRTCDNGSCTIEGTATNGQGQTATYHGTATRGADGRMSSQGSGTDFKGNAFTRSVQR